MTNVMFKFGFVPAARLWLGEGSLKPNHLTRWEGIFKFGFVGEALCGGVGGAAPVTKAPRGAVSEGGTPSDARRKPQEN